MTTTSRTASQFSRRQWLKASLLLGASGYLPLGSIRAWGNEPLLLKHKKLHFHSEKPLNGEPNLGELVKSNITPLEHFYVRNHGPIPEIAADAYSLSLEGFVGPTQTLSLNDLATKFKQVTIEATMTCAGNRRTEMAAQKAIKGVQWKEGAIGNATWTGPLLNDVLAQGKISSDIQHVWFEGADPITEPDGSVAPFGASIRIKKALTVHKDLPNVILALQMNGKPLTAEHGAPVRMVVPGFIGARSVKWLKRIILSDKTSPNHYLADAYKIITADEKRPLHDLKPIYEFPINACICEPAKDSTLKAGEQTIRGYALPMGETGCQIAKVEVSIDEGKTWSEASLDTPSRAFTWRLWSSKQKLTPEVKSILVRATDSLGRVQPQTTPWNTKGYLQNSWHRCAITVEA